MSERKILTDYVYQIVASLVQNGVEDAVISPGSRSTPLAYAFASTKEMNVYRQVDERSAAFFALGLAKSKAKPVVLLCTSGTAAANYFPAIVEAKYARVPLIVITADRPHELREVGAPQAINQLDLYGKHVKWFAEFPIPDDHSQTLPFIERHVARAVGIANTHPFGPVHMNVPFREPLLIDFRDELPKSTFSARYNSSVTPSTEAMNALSSIIRETKRGIIVIGELALGTHPAYLWSLIRKLKWPVLVESLSNMRGNVPEDCMEYVIATYDALLKSEEFKKRAGCDTVIRFGAQPVSKFLTIFLTEMQPANYVVIDEDPLFRDSSSVSTHSIHASIGSWLEEMEVHSSIEEEYRIFWQSAERIAMKHIQAYSGQEKDEGAFVQYLLEHLPEKSDLFVSNSMPVRDIDTFLLPTKRDIQIFANRGANGIDGVISTAFGFSKGRRDRETYLLIGDLAALHDINAFLLTRYQPCNMTVIVLNNDGGGIFSYLSQATVKEYYEDLFGTPTALQFHDVAHMYGMDYVMMKEFDEREKLFEKSGRPLRLIEIMTNRGENVEAHRRLWQQIHSELKEWLL
ncbi:2-succinyl-5-enolpyruvyl-6-hydroxy-3-cyclohexene-1-carboxylic-acid synthase [Ureibacillus suwonensis]|uniref:2-succinyl-5-enolpyruvyl-6-hydroxy-3-cyclohexene-1-carboxylate synthase n=1 Tax=Ureibacillus suwonensis TaxID=313007 RepID=A0ABW0RAZ9_9BACL